MRCVCAFALGAFGVVENAGRVGCLDVGFFAAVKVVVGVVRGGFVVLPDCYCVSFGVRYEWLVRWVWWRTFGFGCAKRSRALSFGRFIVYCRRVVGLQWTLGYRLITTS